jgi:GAF domain-containing protein
MPDDAPIDLAGAVAMLTDLASGFAGSPPLDEALQRTLEIAIDFVPGCEQAGLSVLRKKSIETPASEGALAAACDALQQEIGEGPGITALLDADTLRIDDLATDDRWPAFAAAAVELGVRSMLSCRLATPRDRIGALNLYSTVPKAFDETTEIIAIAYATHVGMSLAALDRETNLRTALGSREIIGQAMGILMERHKITATQAFELIVQVSQRANLKLRVIAEELVRTGALPA